MFDLSIYSYYDVLSFLKNNFGLNRGEIQELIKEWLGEVYNLRVNTPGFYDQHYYIKVG